MKGGILTIYFFLIPDRNSITTYSGRLFAEGLSSAGYSVKIVWNEPEKIHILQTIQNGTIIFQKCAHPMHQADSIRHLKGKIGLIHIDDDLMDMGNPKHLDTIRLTDLVLVSSLAHQEKLRQYTHQPSAPIRALHDLDNYPYYPFSERKNRPLIIAWQQSCADAYVNDLLTIADPLLNLFNQHKYQLKFYGWRLGKDYPDKRSLATATLPFSELIPYAPLDDYLSITVPEIRQSDIFIVPYIDHPSRLGKGGFGMKRMMLLGVPVVASNIGVHQEIITDGVNGFLAGSPDEWLEKLGKLLADECLREQFSIQGRKLMENEYGYRQCLDIFIKAIQPYLK